MPEQAPPPRAVTPVSPGVTPLYRAVIRAVSFRIRALGLTMGRVDELSGVQDGYCAKALHPDAPSGRQSRWETLQLIIDALYPEGLSVTLKANPVKSGKHLNRLSRQSASHVISLGRRIDVREAGRRGGLASLAVRMTKHSPEQRSAIARKAARARARNLTPQERTEIARGAAIARWRVRERANAQAMG
jgi:hypothetical protein